MGARLKRIGAVARVEFPLLVRDRAHLALIFVLPIFQILLYGYAIGLEPRHVTTWRWRPTRRPGCPRRWTRSTGRPGADAPEAGRPGGFGRSARCARTARPGSGSRSVTRSRDAGVTVRIIADSTGDPAEGAPGAGRACRSACGSRSPRSMPRTRAPVLSRPSGCMRLKDESAWMIAPGLIGMIVMVTMLFLGSLVTLVREREAGPVGRRFWPPRCGRPRP